MTGENARCQQPADIWTQMELFILDLSFIGWQIVGSLCLGIGTFWVNAYREATIAEYYRYYESNQVIDRDF